MAKYRRFLFPALSGVLTALSFTGSTFLPMVFFSLIPLIIEIYVYGNAFKKMYTFSAIFYCSVSLWLFNAVSFLQFSEYVNYVLIFLLILIISFTQGFLMSLPFLFFDSIKNRGLTWVIMFAFLYISGEFIQEFIPIISFPWARLSAISSSFTVFIQSASLLGSLFVSLTILLINGLSALFIISLINRKIQLQYLILSTAVFSLCIMYGAVSLSEDIPVPDKKALIVQGNYTGTDKRNLTPYEMIENYASLTSENIESNTDIVIYPETAIPINIFDASREKDALTDLSSKHDLTIITGFAYSSDSKTYNAVSAILPDGKILKPYCKQILVPFGEKIPFRDTLVRYIPQLWNVGIFSEGDNSDSLSTPCGEIGGIICYESIYPHIARKSVSGGAEVLVIVSNDSWFGQSAALYQHHSSAVLRAVENNRYVLRSSSTAITSAISPKGKVIALAEPYRDCAVTVEFSAIQKRTLYSRVGDIIVIPSIVIFIITIYKTISRSLPDNKKLPYQRH